MTFLEFLDKQIGRIKAPAVAGAGIFILTGAVLYMAARYPELRDDDLFKTLAQAIVVQGLVGLAMAAWFTKERHHSPEDVNVKNGPENPVPVDDGDTK